MINCTKVSSRASSSEHPWY